MPRSGVDGGIPRLAHRPHCRASHRSGWLLWRSCVEIAGFVGSGHLDVGAVARSTDATGSGSTERSARSADLDPGHVDVVVRVDRQPIHHVRATLLALRSMPTGRHVVVDLGSPSRGRVAGSGVRCHLRGDRSCDDHNGLKTCNAASATPIFFLLDAGDIPSAAGHQRVAAADG